MSNPPDLTVSEQDQACQELRAWQGKDMEIRLAGQQVRLKPGEYITILPQNG